MIPSAVQKQADQAEELARKVAAAGELEEETPEVTEEVEAVEEQVTEEEAPSSQDDWEHKYKVLQGKYNAEVPRLQEENRKLQGDMRLFQEKLDLLERFIAEHQTQSASQAPTTEVSEDESVVQLKEDFPEVYSGIMKLLEGFRAEIQQMLEDRVQPVSQAAEQTALAAFKARLSALVPGWMELNTDSGFLEWLKVRDRFTGLTRHEILMKAFEDRDADRVAEFFLAYESENQPKKTSHTPTVPPQGKPYSPKVDAGPQGKYWTAEEVKDFYTKKALGKLSASEAAKTEADILNAMREGRVRGMV